VRAGAVYFNPGRRRRILICNVPFYGMHSHGVLDFSWDFKILLPVKHDLRFSQVKSFYFFAGCCVGDPAWQFSRATSGIWHECLTKARWLLHGVGSPTGDAQWSIFCRERRCCVWEHGSSHVGRGNGEGAHAPTSDVGPSRRLQVICAYVGTCAAAFIGGRCAFQRMSLGYA
jgi:hypothetical protein